MKVKSLGHVQLLATPWTAAFQAPPSMGFSRQEYWSEVPLPSPTLTLISFFFFTSLNANKTMIVQFCDLTSQCVIISTLNIYDCFSVFFCLVTHSFKSYFMIKFTFLRTESICGIILLTFNLLGCFQLINCKQICALVFYRRHDIS